MDTFTVVLDDERTFRTDQQVVYLRTVDEALAWFAAWWTRNQFTYEVETIDSLYLDHDLAEVRTSLFVVDFLNRLAFVTPQHLPIRQVLVHSQNPVGANNLMRSVKFCDMIARILLPDLV